NPAPRINTRECMQRTYRGGRGTGPTPASEAGDVLALTPGAVVRGAVRAPVDHAVDRFDPEVGVAYRAVAGQLRGRALDVEAVVTRGDGEVSPQQASSERQCLSSLARIVRVLRTLPAPSQGCLHSTRRVRYSGIGP